MPYEITSISSTQFKVEKKDELTNTIVEETKTFNKNEAYVSVDSDICAILDKADSQGLKMPISMISIPAYTDFIDLDAKLFKICFT